MLISFFNAIQTLNEIFFHHQCFYWLIRYLMPNGFALFSFDAPIHITSVFVLLILRPERSLKRSNT